MLLCSARRSGSTLLGEALHATGRLGCPLEYFFFADACPGIAERWGAPRPAELRPSPAQAPHRPGRHPRGQAVLARPAPAVCRDLAGAGRALPGQPPDGGCRAGRAGLRRRRPPGGELFPNPSISCCGGATCSARAVWTSSPGRPAAGARSLAPTGRPWRSPPTTGRRSTPGSARSCTSRSPSHGRAARRRGRLRGPGPRLGRGAAPLLAGLLGDGVTVPAPRPRRQSDARTERILPRYLADRASTLTAR